jgi:hypothetical protein
MGMLRPGKRESEELRAGITNRRNYQMSMSSFSIVRRHPRTLSLLAALSVVVTGLSLGGLDAIAAIAKPNFVARDATRFSEKS